MILNRALKISRVPSRPSSDDGQGPEKNNTMKIENGVVFGLSDA